MVLEEYRRRRDFRRTGEPRGRGARRRRATGGRFVVQRHDARRLHYDFRLELDGVLKSWAVPKGPSLVPGEKRLAAETEDHPLEYAEFEGRIPTGEYGAGKVAIWDRGRWEAIGDPHAGLAKGALEFRLAGEKLRGRWRLVRMGSRNARRGRASWLLIKGHDEPRKAASPRDDDHLQALPCAERAPLPRTLAPELATLVDEAPDGDTWLHELKLDGYRLIARLENGRARLLTRAGHDWTDRFAGLAAALEKLPVRAALFDGEAVVLDAEGRSQFQALQQALAGGRGEIHLFLFDCLYLDGWNLRECRLDLRKEVLRALFDQVPAGSPLRFSDHQTGGGPAFFAEACRSGVEGIVSKRADAPYRSRRSRAWLKVKCTRRQELVIAGYTDPAGSRTGLGALLLAAHDDDGTLRYAGKVGTGFDAATLADLRARLARLEREKPAVAGAPRARGQHWVEPRLVAEVAFTEWTADRRVRHPSFVGLREDKPASQVRFERAKPLATAAPAAPIAGGASVAQVAGVRLSTPDRVYFPESGITKLELAQYYEQMQARVLPGLELRPLTLLRCPEGRESECFYQKRADRSIPAIVPRIVVKKGRAPYAMVQGLPSLVALVQLGVLELHVWGARADRLDRPDILVVDLDPDPSVPWRRVADTALLLRELFDELGLVPFVRSTGGKGLHVVVPLERRTSWEELKRFAQAVVAQLVRTAPGEYTASMSKAQRHGKIFLDVFRNAPEATAVASWSVRARPGAPVAAPLAWERLRAKERPVLSLRDALATLSESDPWAQFETSRRPLTRAMFRRVGADA
jgi:bifunctional non-homologous end joining protein LigD